MSKTRGGVTMITSNSKQPYLFAVSMDSSRSKVKIQAKHKTSSDTFLSEYNENGLKKIGFYSNVKGFYNRLKMAIESKSPDELRAYYNIHSKLMTIVLEEVSKYDDDSSKWSLSLKKKKK
eukprot:137776_1